MPSPLIPGLHCSVYDPAGMSTVSSAEVPGPTFSRSPAMLPSARRTYSSLTRLPMFFSRSVTVPAVRRADDGVQAVSVAVTTTRAGASPDPVADVTDAGEEHADRPMPARTAVAARTAARAGAGRRKMTDTGTTYSSQTVACSQVVCGVRLSVPRSSVPYQLSAGTAPEMSKASASRPGS